MSRKLAENVESYTPSTDDVGEIGEPAAIPYPNDSSSDQEELTLRPIGSNVQVTIPGNAVSVDEPEDYNPINREITTNIEINHFIDLIMSDSFNEQGGNSLLAQNGIRLKEDFEGILVVGETIIVVDKDLGESS